MDIISEIDSKKLDEYFKRTRNTICGRNPISIVLIIIENYKKKNSNKQISFVTVGYAQSNKVKNSYETSVSYAAVVNYVN